MLRFLRPRKMSSGSEESRLLCRYLIGSKRIFKGHLPLDSLSTKLRYGSLIIVLNYEKLGAKHWKGNVLSNN